MSYHVYADDLQIYATFLPGDVDNKQDVLSHIEACVSDMKYWMAANYLKLNQEKTEILVVKKKNTKQVFEVEHINIGDTAITPSQTVRNLGVLFDSHLSMKDHVRATCKRAFFEIRNISRIRQFLDTASTKTLVHAYVTSKLDYCNSLLIGLPKCELDKLQRVMNCAARLITRKKKRDHITPVLHSLHWLLVPERVEFKILLLTFKALNGLAPTYLTELLKLHCSGRSLRSNNQMLLDIPRT